MTLAYTNPVKGIHVYDDVFGKNFSNQFIQFVYRSMFQIGWSDEYMQREEYLHSNWCMEDLIECGILNQLEEAGVFPQFPHDRFAKAMVNLDTIGDTHWTHTHPDQDVVLIYVNTEWKDEWGGETLWFDKQGKEIVYGSRFTPNRVICFNGEIPHKIIPPSPRFENKFRFTLAICLWRPGKGPCEEVLEEPAED